jgi:hypothetical protein
MRILATTLPLTPLALVCLQFASPDVRAATVTVSNCNDSGAGSLRAAASAALSGDTIDLTQTGCSRIKLTSGAIAMAQRTLTLQGPGVYDLVLDGNFTSSVLRHTGSGTLRINGLVIEHGEEHAIAAKGGCVYSAGNLDIRHSHIRHCGAQGLGRTITYAYGGGLYAKGSGYLFQTTVHSNAVRGTRGHTGGGGIFTLGHLNLNHSRVVDNYAGGGRGGGLLAEGGLSTNYATVAANTAGDGGGILAIGDVTISNSTISGNRARSAGGIRAEAWWLADQLIVNSTISGNVAKSEFSAGHLSAQSITVANSTIAFNNNTSTSCPPYDSGAFVGSNGGLHLQSTIIANNTCQGIPSVDLGSTSPVEGNNNLIMRSNVIVPTDTLSSDPRLAPLADNGGVRKTHALLEGSPAIDTGNNTAGLLYDQRGPGYPRVKGVQADIGAYED